MKIRVTTDNKAAEERLKRIQKAFAENQGEMGQLVEKVAMRTYTALVQETPKKWTGNTRRSWQVIKNGEMSWSVTNKNKVMAFLEYGTKDHGPVKKKALYIPLTRAASYGWKPTFKMGTDYILRRRVKGIKARKIVEKQNKVTQTWLKADMKAFIREILK